MFNHDDIMSKFGSSDEGVNSNRDEIGFNNSNVGDIDKAKYFA